MARAADWLRILRPLNGLVAAWAVLVGAAVAMPLWGHEEFPWPRVLGAMAAAFLLAGYGNVANDIADRAIDRAAHPIRPLAAGRMGTGAAALYAAALANAGLALALLAGGPPLLLFAAANAALLLLYAAWLKAVPLAGNVVVAALAASAFPFGAAAVDTGRLDAGLGSLAGFAAMALLAHVARENAKGLEDARHDEGRLTLARLSPTAARVAVAACVAAACALALWMVLPAQHPFWLERPLRWDGVGAEGPGRVLGDSHLGLWRWGVAASVPVFAAGAAAAWRSPRASQRLLKAAMLVAMAGYSWGALLAFQGG